jgi:ribosomal protein L30E
MKLVISGGRDYRDEAMIYDTLGELNPSYIFIGDCPSGVDERVTFFAELNNIPIVIFKADWEKHGKAAGPIRNTEMIKNATEAGISILLAFPGGKGTENAIKTAKEHNMIVLRVES